MPEPILLLRLEGPLQCWGVHSRWSRRDTGPEPSKSAIIGLLGCAAGILRPDWRSSAEPVRTLEHWDNALRFGVRIDRPGTIETDYHTVQGRHWQADEKLKREKKEVKYSGGKWVFWSYIHTEVTWRDYLHDAAFLVALALKPEHLAGNRDLLDNLKASLQDPKWPLYLAARPVCLRVRSLTGWPTSTKTWRALFRQSRGQPHDLLKSEELSKEPSRGRDSPRGSSVRRATMSGRIPCD